MIASIVACVFLGCAITAFRGSVYFTLREDNPTKAVRDIIAACFFVLLAILAKIW